MRLLQAEIELGYVRKAWRKQNADKMHLQLFIKQFVNAKMSINMWSNEFNYRRH